MEVHSRNLRGLVRANNDSKCYTYAALVVAAFKEFGYPRMPKVARCDRRGNKFITLIGQWQYVLHPELVTIVRVYISLTGEFRPKDVNGECGRCVIQEELTRYRS
jgi:hypothetical protein